MILMMLALAQSAPPEDERSHRASVDLPAAWHPASCPTAESGSDIVVCGRQDVAEKFRARPLPEKYAEVGGPGIGVDLGKGARGNLYAAQAQSPDGKPDKRIMVTVTMPF